MHRPLRRLGLSIATAALLVTTAAPAFAHASFDKSQVPADTEIDLTFNAPQERASTNERIEALAPAQFTVLECTAPEGWTCDVDASQPEAVITWEAGPDALLPESAFPFRVLTPGEDEQGVYAWPVIQIYADGHEAAWIGDDAPTIQVGDSDAPVVANTEESAEHGSDEGEAEQAPDSDKSSASEGGAEPSPSPTAADQASDGTANEGPSQGEPVAPVAGNPDEADEADDPEDVDVVALESQDDTDDGDAATDDPAIDAAAPAGPEAGRPTGIIVAVVALAVAGGVAFTQRHRFTA